MNLGLVICRYVTTGLGECMGTIYVLGNGFDLQCGLKTKYSHFFSWCRKTYPWYKNVTSSHPQDFSFDSNVRNAIDKPEFTVWDLYFIIHSPKMNHDLWCDIEAEMNQSIQTGFWETILDTINDFLDCGTWGNSDLNWYFSYMLYKRYFDDGTYLSRLGFPREFFKSKVVLESEFIEKLLNELNSFEDRFKQYITKEVDEISDSYFKNQELLFEKLINHTIREKPMYVFTFNYTPLIDDYKGDVVKVQNLHGSVLNHPIFGISADSNTKSSFERFTKANRRIQNDIPPISELIEEEDNSVVFYGTSLNSFDIDYYSNVLNFFNKKKNVYFCYSDFDGINNKVEATTSVQKMINSVFPNSFYKLIEQGKIKIVKV